VGTYRIEKALACLNSVLTVPASASHSQPIAIFHASFCDFLVSKARSGAKIYLDPKDCHQFLAISCLKVIEQILKENSIFNVKHKELERHSIPKDAFKEFISSTLEHTCANCHESPHFSNYLTFYCNSVSHSHKNLLEPSIKVLWGSMAFHDLP
jgi:hypothetical protein